jgi:TonB-dependent receptor
MRRSLHARRVWQRACSFLFLAAWLVAPSAVLRAQDRPGRIDGRLVDARTEEPLPGATLTVQGTSLTAITDREGRFQLGGVAPGPQTLEVSYLGRRNETIPVEVLAGAPTRVDARLEVRGFDEQVQVVGELIRDAQARALNQQKTAPNIVNVVSADQIGSFPDANAAETAQRIPGISITKDQGEGRYVNIRGTDARLNAMMIDGERIPSPDPLLRQVALDVVPSELLQGIEVSKALTADVDGDSIGGSVNLVMKTAPDTLRVFGGIGGGYNQMLSSTKQNEYTLTGGRRFNGGRFGAIGSVSGSETTRGNQDLEVVYTSALTLNELNPRYYQVDRRRVGVTGAFDARTSATSSFTLRGVFNRFIDDHENRQRVRWAVGNSRVDRELRDRTHIERIASLGLSGKAMAGTATVDYQLLGAYSDQVDPLTMTTTFRQTKVTFAPNVSADTIDPNNIQANPQNESPDSFAFQSQLRATNFAKDRDIVGAVNWRRPVGAGTTFLKIGAKYRDKAKGRTRNESTYTTSAALRMTDFLETGFDLRPYLDGRYDLRPYLSQSRAETIPTLASFTVARNHARDAEEFDGTERTGAAYAMAEIYVGSKLLLLPGARVEFSAIDFTGRNVRFAPSGGAWLGTDPISATHSYAPVLPSFHVRYAFDANTNLRVAATRSLARPNYYDQVPYRAQDDNASTVALGNSNLRPTSSWNLDVLGEHYFTSVGVVSGGVFYKRLTDYIFSYSNPQVIAGTQYQVTQPLNGDRGSVYGFEAAFQNQFKGLPAPFDGIGIYANYTLTGSSVLLPGHDTRSTLPGQSRHSGNLAASYEKRGFSGRVSTNFHGSYLDTVGASSLFDRYYDTNRQADVSVAQRLTRNLRLYLNLLNINDALLRYYQGVPDRLLQEEHYHWSSTFGVKVTL